MGDGPHDRRRCKMSLRRRQHLSQRDLPDLSNGGIDALITRLADKNKSLASAKN